MNFFQYYESILCILIVYSIISFILFFFPHIIWKKKKYAHRLLIDALKNNKIIHCSHRGGQQENFENTMAAFRHSVKITNGNCMLEMDVHMTKDNQIVVIHDTNLDRLCGINKQIGDFNYKELPQIQDKVFIHFTVKKFYQKQNNEYFPLFEEVLKEFPDNVMINMELKEFKPLLITKVYDLILKYKKQNCVIWGFRDFDKSRILQKLYPEIPVFFSMSTGLKTHLLFLLGLLPFMHIPEHSMQTPFVTEELQIWKMSEANSLSQKVLQWGQFALFKFFTSYQWLINYHLKKRGIIIMHWVLNNEKEFQLAINLGTNGIITDFPTKLFHYLKKRNLMACSN